MPHKDEIKFFRLAFSLLDDINHTNWLQIYSDLEARSPNGRIDWGLIPGLLRRSYVGRGYKRAVERVVRCLNQTTRIPNEEYNRLQLTSRLDELTITAQMIYENRLRKYTSHQQTQGNQDLESGNENEGHRIACETWKKAWESLEEGFTALEMDGVTVEFNDGFQPTEESRPSRFTEISMAIGGVCLVGAWLYLMYNIFY